MTVSVCGVTFSDWVSLSMEGQYSDTFIFRIDSQACLPPFVYVPLLKRIAAKVLPKRSCASLWIQVDGPGQWFVVAIHNALKGLRMPFIVTQEGELPTYERFSLPPVLTHAPLKYPPAVIMKARDVALEELRCLQALGRMIKGQTDEIALLAGLQSAHAECILADLAQRKLVEFKTGWKIERDQSKPVQLDMFPLWHPTSRGLAVALRSWGVPKGIDFSARHEQNAGQIGHRHRHIARLWIAWLRSALPQAQIWAGWSEVRVPGTTVIPDGFAWGKLHGQEVLFWLEVGDGHKSREKIKQVTRTRLQAALKYCEGTGMWLVYTQLGMPWVHRAVAEACVNIPTWAAVMLGRSSQFGALPTIEWGKVSSLL